ncbi:MAG: hypothetical protein VX728_05875, partial [Actinomycetota bacterium]|nr:hypothetical protein [Actinomycetota bacterium]
QKKEAKVHVVGERLLVVLQSLTCYAFLKQSSGGLCKAGRRSQENEGMKMYYSRMLLFACDLCVVQQFPTGTKFGSEFHLLDGNSCALTAT